MSKAFPNLAPGFFDVFLEAADRNGLTDARMMAAIEHVIDTCQYPTPTVANFLIFDQEEQRKIEAKERAAEYARRQEITDRILYPHKYKNKNENQR